MLVASLVLSLLAGSAFAAPKLAKRETHEITVGGNGELKFEPYAIFAEPGDKVVFKFVSKNHSVIQSSFAHPCGPLEGGFRTDFQFVAPDITEDKFPRVEYTVTTDKSRALWFYCSQAINTPNAHCAKGMVFSINCPADGPNSFNNFLSKALADPAATAPPTGPTRDVIVPLTPEPTYTGDITVPPLTTPETKTTHVVVGTSEWDTTYVSYPGSPEPTPSSDDGEEIKVIVGKDGTLAYDPPNVVARPRDTIVFEFVTKNHTVTQSSFAAPCSVFRTADGVAGIDSGFIPAAAAGAAPAQFRVKVNTTEPLYFYCKQGNGAHCAAGMVFSVNTDEKGARSSAAFKALAQQVGGSQSGNNGGNNNGGNNTNGGTPPPGGAAVALGASFGGVALATALAAVAALVL
jgi:plastocyanin